MQQDYYRLRRVKVELRWKLFFYLEEVVFQKVAHSLVARDSPPAVQVKIQKCEPHNQNEGRQFGLVANSDKQHENRSHNILKNLVAQKHHSIPIEQESQCCYLTCMNENSMRRSVANMKTNKILPVNWR